MPTKQGNTEICPPQIPDQFLSQTSLVIVWSVHRSNRTNRPNRQRKKSYNHSIAFQFRGKKTCQQKQERESEHTYVTTAWVGGVDEQPAGQSLVGFGTAVKK